MTEAENGFKVSDRRLFTEEGELKGEAAKAREKQGRETATEPFAADTSPNQEGPEIPMDFKTLVFSFRMNALIQMARTLCRSAPPDGRCYRRRAPSRDRFLFWRPGAGD